MHRIHFACTILLVLGFLPLQAQIELGMPAEPGKCFTKCLIPDQCKYTYETYFRYTGDAEDLPEGVEQYSIVTKPPTTRWVKKKADKNCLSRNPEDCLVWCLIEKPAVSIEVMEVVDTSICKDFIIDSLELGTLVKAGGFTEWVEILCSDDRTKMLITQIQEILIEEGYFLGPQYPNGHWDHTTTVALTALQEYYELAIGDLTFETLEFLEIDW